LRSDPLVVTLDAATKENTVTVMHLIYRSKIHEDSSKDYDFSRLAMVDHWRAGERDAHVMMRDPRWLERPQSGETMVTYDLGSEGLQSGKE